MRIISFNVNGIRAVEKKGALQNLVELQKPDILFLQEIKAKSEQLSDALIHPTGYAAHYHSAEKPGYAGTGVWIKNDLFESFEILRGMEITLPSKKKVRFEDTEGRVLGVKSGKTLVFGNYFPNGGKSHEAWLGKLKFYDHFHQ